MPTYLWITCIQHGTKTHLTEVFKLRTTLLLMQNNLKGLEKNSWEVLKKERKSNNFSSLLYTQQQQNCLFWGDGKCVFRLILIVPSVSYADTTSCICCDGTTTSFLDVTTHHSSRESKNCVFYPKKKEITVIKGMSSN